MTDSQRELEGLRSVCPQASLQRDGTVICVLMPATTLMICGVAETIDVLLCPLGCSGYVTRLLLAHKIDGKPQLNWQTVLLLERTWHTWSWNNIPAAQPWIQIYAEHARLLR